jgi:hypothetical protein
MRGSGRIVGYAWVAVARVALDARGGSVMDAKRAGVLATMLLLSGCVVLSGIDSFEVGGQAKQADASENSAPSGNGDPDNPTLLGPSGDGGGTGTDGGGTPPPPPPVRPLEGTYTYTVKGSDTVTGIVTFSKTYGPTATVTVTHSGDNCFDQKITLRSGYDETMHECIVGDGVVHSTGVRSQTFPLVGSATTNQTCAPGDTYFDSIRAVSQTWPHSCTGKNVDDKTNDKNSVFVTAGPYSFVGEESISIADTSFPVAHFYDDRKVTGSQTGTNVADWWFSTSSGILVKLVRNINIAYSSPIGKVNYIETVTMTLSALPLDGGT